MNRVSNIINLFNIHCVSDMEFAKIHGELLRRLISGQENPSVSHFKRGRGAGVSTESSLPPSHVSSEGGDGGVKKPLTSH
jgi:hypothetical protein